MPHDVRASHDDSVNLSESHQSAVADPIEGESESCPANGRWEPTKTCFGASTMPSIGCKVEEGRQPEAARHGSDVPYCCRTREVTDGTELAV